MEIVQQAGLENNYIFGATVEELESIRDSYHPRALYDGDPILHRAVDTLVDGTVEVDDPQAELYRALLDGATGTGLITTSCSRTFPVTWTPNSGPTGTTRTDWPSAANAC